MAKAEVTILECRAKPGLSRRHRVQRLVPAPLETQGVLAYYQPQDDVLTVWDSTQHPHEVRDQLARVLHRQGERQGDIHA
jgi:carbon-monoxide dehydrogenase large subunit